MAAKYIIFNGKPTDRKKLVSEYVESIKMMLNMKGIEATNAANHMALDRGMINREMFQAGAKVIAAAFLKN